MRDSSYAALPQRIKLSVGDALDLYSLSYVEALLGRTRKELRYLASHAIHYYQPFVLRPKDRPFARKVTTPKKRWIDHPIDPLKAIQSRIQERILSSLILPEHLLGGVQGKSIGDNARLHLSAPCLVTIDIKNFFPTINPQQVQRVFRNLLNCSPDVSYLLTGLTTCRERLPQGAPTSPLLANLVLSSFDHEIRSICAANEIRYSSWIDDLAFSGKSAREIIGPVISVLMKAGFRVSHQKIKIMGLRDRKILNKLVLGTFITVQKQYKSRIRAGINNLSLGKVGDREVGAYIETLKGSINYVGLFDQKKAIRFRRDLEIACSNLKGFRPAPTDSQG